MRTLQKNRDLPSGTSVNISVDALEGIDTPITGADAQASTDAPGSTGVKTSAGVPTDTDAVGNIDVTNAPSDIDFTTAVDQASTDAPSSTNVTTADDHASTNVPPSSTVVLTRANVPASTSAAVKPTSIMSTTAGSTTSEMSSTTTTVSTTTEVVKTTSPTPIARDCSDIRDQGFTENYGIYRIQPSNDSESFEVVCDLETNGEQWIVFQRRFDGSVDFNRAWVDYKNGFGNLNGEHWLGLEKLHMLTTNGNWKLRVDLEDFYNDTGDAEYSSFTIADESTNYILSIGECDSSCSVSDALDYHKNMAFTTYDQDHDINVDENCAVRFQGGWWFGDDICHHANLNGLYFNSPDPVPATHGNKGMRWRTWKHRVLKKSEMKMKRIW